MLDGGEKKRLRTQIFVFIFADAAQHIHPHFILIYDAGRRNKKRTKIRRGNGRREIGKNATIFHASRMNVPDDGRTFVSEHSRLDPRADFSYFAR